MEEMFEGSFTQQLPLSDAAIEAAVRVMRSGRLHRYNSLPGEVAEAAALEAEFAAYMGAKYCVAVTSGGAAMAMALRATGVAPGDAVLSNAFTLAPVPGAIAGVGARPVFVGVTEDLTIDLEDLAAKADASGARVLLLSHMRGHICDMDRLMEVVHAHELTVIEDCAHTMGARWDGTLSGRHGAVACYSTQTYKHMNSGEGGFLVTDDEEIAARAVFLSGSYMFPERHGAIPPGEVFERLKRDVPNMSSRMDNLRAAVLREQLKHLDTDCVAWTERYRAVEAGLRNLPGLRVIERPEKEAFVGSSIQFRLPDWPAPDVAAFVERCKARGVELKWFGAAEPQGFTSTYADWRYAEPERLPETDRVLAGLLDMRIPLTFSLDDCALIARIISDEARRGSAARPAAE
ncbi:DegT/DnrJ/EryC1/StrS family aminotransferase [Ovoidimarina sediminis]|uniref:DegT/DnrJ/EryC1/StrS family aminotransferase n=1 Tax=Ovoidimarina sediminis TaxID=3079856 RepID=UPI00290E13FC|nr:aminotransferase class I/II-fold pyridoxal phosphate-dependent enzyme [Rhodophyticola sp. MJ-SS7]MDU8945854.1 aminotransferase class I/II-fold pyridoxal phosphate-dependent enzyme [Rhodophyticola sp. MJ-SS7]